MIKNILRSFIFNLLVLGVLSYILPGVGYNQVSQLLWASVAITLLQLIVLPILKLLFMPISLLTLGVLSFVPYLVMIAFFFWLNTGYQINSIVIPRIIYGEVSTPQINLGSLGSIVFFGWVYAIIQRLFGWIFK